MLGSSTAISVSIGATTPASRVSPEQTVCVVPGLPCNIKCPCLTRHVPKLPVLPAHVNQYSMLYMSGIVLVNCTNALCGLFTELLWAATLCVTV